MGQSSILVKQLKLGCYQRILLRVLSIPDSVHSVGRLVRGSHSVVFLKPSNFRNEMSLLNVKELFNDLYCCSAC